MADHMTQLQQAAHSAHECFTEYVAAGFEPKQALYLVGCMLTGGPNGTDE